MKFFFPGILASCAFLSAGEHRVLKPDGSPAAGIELILRQAGKPDEKLKTDSKGRFSIENREPDLNLRSALIVDVAGAALGIWNFPGPELKLHPAFAIHGVVQLPDGTLLNGARVTVAEFGAHTYTPLKAYGISPPWEPVMTDREGRFTLRGAVFNGYEHPPGLVVRAEKSVDGRNHSSVRGYAGNGDATFFKKTGRVDPETLRLNLYPHGKFEGRVLDEISGEPVEGAVVMAHGIRGEGSRKVMTGADGSFRFDDLPGHSRRHLSVRRSGYPELGLTQKDPEPPADPDVSGLRILLPPLVNATGTVLDAFSKKPAMGRLGISAKREYDLSPEWTVRMSNSSAVQEDGSFRIGLPAGKTEWLIQSQHPVYGTYRHDQGIDLEPGMEPLALEIPRRPGLFFEMDGAPDPVWKSLSARYSGVGSGVSRFARGSRYFFAEAPGWGGQIEVEVSRRIKGKNEVIFPGKVFEVKPDNWPIKIPVGDDDQSSSGN